MKPITTSESPYHEAMLRFAELYRDELSKPGSEAAFYGACRLMDALFGNGDALFDELRDHLELIGEDPRDYGFEPTESYVERQ